MNVEITYDYYKHIKTSIQYKRQFEFSIYDTL